ncbi:MAG: ribonuclease P protein component [Beutenbergiaceae bacterium]
MLPARHRMRRSSDFAQAIRSGRRTSSRHLVVHLVLQNAHAVPDDPKEWSSEPEPARVGFVVSKAVGNAPQRNRVKRRLRELSYRHLPLLPAGSLTVIRALPAARTALYEELGSELVRCVTAAKRRSR